LTCTLPASRRENRIALAPAFAQNPPIAIGLLPANDPLMSDQLDDFIAVEELALAGQVRPVKEVSLHINKVVQNETK
jgi:predicted ATPase with chaperone activity